MDAGSIALLIFCIPLLLFLGHVLLVFSGFIFAVIVAAIAAFFDKE